MIVLRGCNHKQKTGKQDVIRVNNDTPSEVEYLQKKFVGKTHEEIVRAVHEVGPFRKDI